MGPEQKYFRRQHKLSGVPVKQLPPNNPYRVIGPEQASLIEIRSITSRLGFISERALVGLWEGSTHPTLSDTEKVNLNEAINSVLNKLKTVQKKTINNNDELSSHYQKLTLPPEIPFMGDERTGPSEDDLAYIFNVVDAKFKTAFRDSSLQTMLHEVGTVYGSEVINPKVRYPIEVSLALARLLLKPPKAPKGRILGNQLYPINSKQRVQFDAVIIPSKFKIQETEKFDLASYVDNNNPWATVQVKFPFRARYVSGPNKLGKSIDRHLAQFERQLARIIIHREDQHFNFPKYVLFVYLRGVYPSVAYYVRFDYWRISQWRKELEDMFDNEFFTGEETQRKSAHLLQVLTNEENKMHDEIIREAETGKKITKTKDQLHFPYRYRLDL